MTTCAHSSGVLHTLSSFELLQSRLHTVMLSRRNILLCLKSRWYFRSRTRQLDLSAPRLYPIRLNASVHRITSSHVHTTLRSGWVLLHCLRRCIRCWITRPFSRLHHSIILIALHMLHHTPISTSIFPPLLRERDLELINFLLLVWVGLLNSSHFHHILFASVTCSLVLLKHGIRVHVLIGEAG